MYFTTYLLHKQVNHNIVSLETEIFNKNLEKERDIFYQEDDIVQWEEEYEPLSKSNEGGIIQRINTKYLFLTYPRCPLFPLHVIAQLIKIFRVQSIDKYLIVRDLHKNGEPHIHVWLQLVAPKDFKTTQALQSVYLKPILFESMHSQEESEVRFKCNIQSMRVPQAVLQYLRKSLERLKNQIPNPTQEDLNEIYVTNLDLNACGFLENPFEKALFLAENNQIDKALQLVRDRMPNYYVTNFARLKTTLELHALRQAPTPYFNLNDFKLPQCILDWLTSDATKFSLYLSGKPNIGKTQAIYSLLFYYHYNPVIIRHVEDLKNVDWKKCKAVIFDDLCFHKKTYSQKLNLTDVMQDTTIRVLFGVVNVPSGVIKVFTSNLSFAENLLKQPKDETPFNSHQVQALLRRVYIVHMETTFFKKPLSVVVPPVPCVITENATLVDNQYQKWSDRIEIKPIDSATGVMKEKTVAADIDVHELNFTQLESKTPITKRLRGRPRKVVSTQIESEPLITKKPRGRPRNTKSIAASDLQHKGTSPDKTIEVPRPRGRPPKLDKIIKVPRPRGRPPKVKS